jgi:hypothetical protein
MASPMPRSDTFRANFLRPLHLFHCPDERGQSVRSRCDFGIFAATLLGSLSLGAPARRAYSLGKPRYFSVGLRGERPVDGVALLVPTTVKYRIFHGRESAARLWLTTRGVSRPESFMR